MQIAKHASIGRLLFGFQNSFFAWRLLPFVPHKAALWGM
jgi:hypothetical protein